MSSDYNPISYGRVLPPLESLEDFEAAITRFRNTASKPFIVYSGDAQKRSTFKQYFESPEALQSRRMYISRSNGRASKEVSELANEIRPLLELINSGASESEDLLKERFCEVGLHLSNTANHSEIKESSKLLLNIFRQLISGNTIEGVVEAKARFTDLLLKNNEKFISALNIAKDNTQSKEIKIFSLICSFCIAYGRLPNSYNEFTKYAGLYPKIGISTDNSNISKALKSTGFHIL